MPDNKQQSFFSKFLGRSLISVVFGNFFEKKNNAAAMLAIILVLTLCWLVIVKEKYELTTGLLNIVFVIIGYYFGVKQTEIQNEEDE